MHLGNVKFENKDENSKEITYSLRNDAQESEKSLNYFSEVQFKKKTALNY